MARYSKLTKQLCEDVQKLLEEGLPDKAVYGYLNIGHSSFYDWDKAGQALAEKAEELDPDAVLEEIFSEGELLKIAFSEGIKKGRAGFLKTHQANINKKSKYDWKASAWALERRDPENYRDRSRESVNLQHSGEVTHKNVLEILLADTDKPEEK